MIKRAMILAAGRGARMRPLTDHTPKPLLKVGAKPLIVWHIERLKAAGIESVVINHAHLGAQIESALGDGQQWGVNIDYSAEATALETAGGIANALPLLTENGRDERPFLVVNGDVFTDIDFKALTLAPSDLLHLMMVHNPEHNPEGDFVVAEGRLLTSAGMRYTFSGIGLYRPALFASLTKGQPYRLAPLIREAIAQGQAAASVHQGLWHDIGTPARLEAINQQFGTPNN